MKIASKIILLLCAIFIAVLAYPLSQSLYSVFISSQLTLRSGANATFENNNTLTMYGQGSIKTGDSVLFKAGATIARIDSFTTSATADTVSWLGARTGDVFLVNKYSPAYSATADTGCDYEAHVLSSNNVLVTRTKRSAASTLKSGALYGLIGFSKQ